MNFFILASCTTLSVLCKSFQRTLSSFAFPERLSISFCLRFRSFNTNFRHDITEASFVLFIWLIKFVLKSGCKGMTFIWISKIFAEKNQCFYYIFIKNWFISTYYCLRKQQDLIIYYSVHCFVSSGGNFYNLARKQKSSYLKKIVESVFFSKNNL